MISIITPCKNIASDPKRLEFFYKLLKSIKSQTLKDVEHIIIDGNSQDGTKSILEEIGTGISIVSEADNGVYEAMNKGVIKSRGEYIIIMNSDDYFIDNFFLKESIDILERDREIDYVHANKLISSRKDSVAQTIKRGNEKEAFYRMPYRHNTMVIRRSSIMEVGLYDEEYTIVSDYKFVLRLILSGKKGSFIDRIVINSLDGGISSNREKCIEEVSALLFEIYGKLYGLSQFECRQIYLRNFTSDLISKIKTNIKNPRILESLLYGINSSLNHS